MPLIARIHPDHTIREFRVAAGLRYHEGRSLIATGHRLAGIYLWGYAAEMLLKAAYFRLLGWLPNQSITIADLAKAKKDATSVFKLTWPGSLHDLGSWGELLVEERKLRGVPYPGPFARRLRAQVKALFLNWRETLRYRINRPFKGEVERCHESLRWLQGQYRHL
jgi:hypothetical protein